MQVCISSVRCLLFGASLPREPPCRTVSRESEHCGSRTVHICICKLPSSDTWPLLASCVRCLHFGASLPRKPPCRTVCESHCGSRTVQVCICKLAIDHRWRPAFFVCSSAPSCQESPPAHGRFSDIWTSAACTACMYNAAAMCLIWAVSMHVEAAGAWPSLAACIRRLLFGAIRPREPPCRTASNVSEHGTS